MNFHHFIITRFNVNIYPMDFPPRLEETWLSDRFALFQKFCFPTLTAQMNKNFTWLVLFDEQTPAPYRKIIQAYARFSNFVPLFCGAFDTIIPTTVAAMREIAPDADWFLTTRLDNDDALSTRFVHCLQSIVAQMDEASLKPSDKLYINFPKGLQWHNGHFYDFEDLTNAFVSLLERPDDPHTVFWVNHPSIYDVAPVIQAETKPLWLQNVHDLNVYNYVRGEKLDATDVAADFPCDFAKE